MTKRESNPKTIDHNYTVVSPLGEGMSGEVYHVKRGKEDWALKLLKLATDPKDQESLIEAFKFEFSLLKDIQHEHVVGIGDFGWDRDLNRLYFTQELVDGVPLDQFLEDHDPVKAEELFVQCLEGLDAIHQANALHGDIKPSNIFICTTGEGAQVKILDLGVAHPRFQATAGTPSYMAPEKVLRDVIDAKSDLYSLAVTFYECLTGTNPFRRESMAERLKAQTSLMPAAPGSLNPQIPPYLNRILFRLLAKNPRDRFASARDVLTELSTERGSVSAQRRKAPIVSERWVGRSDSIENIRKWAEGLEEFSVFIITGESGLGKSRLLQEMKYELELQGHSVRVLSDLTLSGNTKDVTFILDLPSYDKEGMSKLLKRLSKNARGLLMALSPDSFRKVEQLIRKEKIASQSCTLLGLTADDIRQLIIWSSNDDNPPQALVEAIHQETAGHTGHTVNLLRALCETNKLIDDHGRWNLALFREGVVDIQALQGSEQLVDDLLSEVGKNRPQARTTLLLTKVRDQLRMNQHEGIDDLLKEADQLSKKVKGSEIRLKLRAELLERKAWLCIQEGKLGEAGRDIEAAKVLLEEMEELDRPLQLRLLNFQAYALNQSGHIDQAIEIFRDTHHQWQQLSAEEKSLVVNNDFGVTLMQKGQYEEAIKILEEYLAFHEGLGDLSYKIRTHYLLGECYLQNANRKDAIHHYRESAAGARQLRKWDLLLRAYNGLGNAFNQLNKPNDTIDHYNRALDLARYLKDYLAAAAVAQNIGVIEKELGRTAPARENLELSLKLLKQANEGTPHALSLKARAMLELGEISREQHEYDKARDLLTEVRHLITNEKSLEGFLFYIYQALSLLALDQENYEDFSSLYPDLLHHATTKEQQERVEFLRKRSPLDPTSARSKSSQLKAVAPKVDQSAKIDAPTVSQINLDKEPLHWLEAVLEINQFLNTERNLPALLSLVLKYALKLSKAESGLILLVNTEGELSVATSQNIDVDEDLSQISQHVAKQTLREGRALRSDNAMEDENFKEYRSVMLLGLKSIFCVPIRSQGKVIGVLYLIHRFQTSLFDDSLERIVQAFADQAGLAIENARLINRIEEQNRLLAGQLHDAEDKIEGYEALIREKSLETRYPYSEIIAQSAAMEKVFHLLDRITATDLSVLIHGESGTGKELIARALHQNSPRCKKKFIAINCGALPANLIESELFGYKAGAFTGANRDKKGLLEEADGGTIFLDEIGELDTSLQVKLLRTLQEREIVRLGDTQTIPINVRVVSATHQDLKSRIASGEFREDLFYRLAEIQLDLPPLRERKDDIPLLAQHFIKNYMKEQNLKKAPRISQDLMKVFINYRWPGNVRELSNRIRVACALSDGKTIELADLPEADRKALKPQFPFSEMSAPRASESPSPSFFEDLLQQQMHWKDIESIIMAKALMHFDFDVVSTAHSLGVGQATLYNRLRKEKFKRRRQEYERFSFSYENETKLDDIKKEVFALAFRLSDERPYHAARMLGVSPGSVYRWLPS